MKHALPAFATCAMVAIATIGTPIHARADGGQFAAGLLGGLAAGAIIGSAVAPRPYYAPAPVYVAPPPLFYEAPPCYWTRGQPVWNGYTWIRPRVQICD
jgi:hypothetical protein